MNYHRTLTLVLVLLSSLLTPHASLGQEVRWRHDYNAARREATERGMPLLLDFGTDKCVWCDKLDATTFRDPALVALLNEQVVSLKLDGHRHVTLVEALRIQAYPTLVLAGPDGKIFDTLEGYVEAPKLREVVQRLLATVEVPAGMVRDYQEAVSAVEAADHGQALGLLRRVLQDGKDRPIQGKARQLVREIERQAETRLARLKELVELGQAPLVLEALSEFARAFAGTRAAAEGADLGKKLAERPEVKSRLRERRARELIVQAREDFQAKRFLACLECCDLLTARFADLPENAEALELSAAMKDHPERLQQLCAGLSERWGAMQLLLAEGLLKQGRPADAAAALEEVRRRAPGSDLAERARARLEQVRALFPREAADAPRE